MVAPALTKRITREALREIELQLRRDIFEPKTKLEEVVALLMESIRQTSIYKKPALGVIATSLALDLVAGLITEERAHNDT